MSNQDLFVSTFVYLLAAVVAVTVFKKIGLSAVLGYLVAGVVIGPFGVGFVGSEGADVMHFAEFGVVMMLFLIGLELQPSVLWKLRGPIVGLGGGQVAATTLLMAGIAMLSQLPWQTALAIGMAISLSSTAIVMQSLQEKGTTNTTGGRGVFSVLLFQDMAVIPMLALMPLLAVLPQATSDTESDAHGHADASVFQEWLSHQPAAVQTFLVLAAVGAIILAGKFLLRPILRMVAQTGVREAFVALALVLVIGIALLMTSLGVSAALGTFLAGVVLADSEYRHELEADIEPFKGLLLGVFFIAVGASIDFNLIVEQPLLVLAIVLGIAFFKALVNFILSTIAGIQMDQRLLFSFALAQGSEFAFVLLGFAASSYVLDQETMQLLIASVALTMALSPILMLFEEKVLRPRIGTKETESRPEDDMNEDAPVILAGVGRFGNFVARMLLAQKINITVIDFDSEHVDYLRKFGIKTFYGDVRRHDLLEAAGAAKAKVLVLAVGNEDIARQVIETAKKHFPHLKIIVRALSREHLHELINHEVELALHQHLGSSVMLAEKTLCALGYRSHQAARIAKKFARHDMDTAQEVANIHAEEKTYISKMRHRMAELENQFQQVDDGFRIDKDNSWDTRKLREDALEGNYSDIVPNKDK